MTPVSLVVPVYNEQDRITEHLPAFEAWVGSRPDRSLLFVDDGSADGTAELLAERTRGWASVLRRPHAGKGAAVAAGLEAVEGQVLAFCDADLSTPLDDLDTLVDLARRAPVLAIGSRDVLGASLPVPESKVRETLGRTYNRLVQLLLTPGVLDTQCGAKAARREVWEEVLPHCREQGFAWDAEVVRTATGLGIPVREVGVRWSHDPRSRVDVLRDGLRMVAAAFRITVRAKRLPTAPSVPGPDRPATTSASDPAGGLLRASHTHWWHRSRGALVATTLRRLDPRREGWLVDVGAGTGASTTYLGWDPTRTLAVEPDRRLASASVALGLTTVQGLAQSVPVRSGVGEVVTMLDVLEHDPDPVALLTDARRLLCDRGILIVLVPAHRWLWSAHDERVGHLQRYTAKDLRRHLGAAGLEVEAMQHVLPWAVPPVLIVRRLLGRPATGLEPAPAVIDRMALVLTSIERHLLWRVRLPVGVSLLAVARRAEQAAGAGESPGRLGQPR